MKTVDYKKLLHESLEDKEFAASYLAEVLEKEAYSTFLIALREVIEARGQGLSSLADEVGVTRQALYKILSADGNPRLSTLNDLLRALGFKISVESFDGQDDKDAA